VTSEEYNPPEIEARWRAHWDATRRDQFDLDGASRPFYNLMEFPTLQESLYVDLRPHVLVFPRRLLARH
jgi:leucyl-tRNA synthetase